MTGPHRSGPRPAVLALALALGAIFGVAVVRVVVSLGDEPEPQPMVSSQPHVSATVTTTVSAVRTTFVPTVTTTTTAVSTTVPPIASNATNPLTQPVSMDRNGCPLPPWTKTDEGMAVLLTAETKCLDDSWRLVFDQLKLPFTAPKLVLTDKVTADDCGRPPEQNSFYCEGTIYLVPSSYLTTNAGSAAVPAAAVSLLAHEYGHHLQQLSGTLQAVTAQIRDAGVGTPAALDLSRRTELQAQCLSGMFVGTHFDGPSTAAARTDNYTRGDAPGAVPDHGTPKNFGDWFTVGAQRNSLQDCNTWSAPPDAVR